MADLTGPIDPLAGQQPSVSQPVIRIPGDPVHDAPTPGMALCLSGGGFPSRNLASFRIARRWGSS